jgi:hypothetical protein
LAFNACALSTWPTEAFKLVEKMARYFAEAKTVNILFFFDQKVRLRVLCSPEVTRTTKILSILESCQPFYREQELHSELAWIIERDTATRTLISITFERLESTSSAGSGCNEFKEVSTRKAGETAGANN